MPYFRLMAAADDAVASPFRNLRRCHATLLTLAAFAFHFDAAPLPLSDAASLLFFFFRFFFPDAYYFIFCAVAARCHFRA